MDCGDMDSSLLVMGFASVLIILHVHTWVLASRFSGIPFYFLRM